jgi:5'-AMP-activated protein kinase regulatory gamma subunit
LEESDSELGSQPLPTITSDDVDTQSIPRPRSGTWGSKADSKQKSKDVAKPKAKEGKSKQPKEAKTEGKKDRKRDKHSGSRSGSASRSNSAERRKSGDDVQSPKKAGMLDAFRARSNSDASKKKGSAFMASMKSAMLHTGLMHARKAPRDGSAHPVRDGSSHTQYYHTVTAASSNKSPMTKVMDIFRNRSHASVPPEDRRKKAAQQLAGAHLRQRSLDTERRRQSLGTILPHRASDAFVDPYHAAILFRDARGVSRFS